MCCGDNSYTLCLFRELERRSLQLWARSVETVLVGADLHEAGENEAMFGIAVTLQDLAKGYRASTIVKCVACTWGS